MPPISAQGKEALLAAIRDGKGFIGIHSASDTFHSKGKHFQTQEQPDPYIAIRHRHTPMITTMHSDQNASPPRVEVITSVQRRRRWPTAEKIRLVEETMQPGMSGPTWPGERASLPACCSTGVDECWKAAGKRSSLTKMWSERAVSVSWNDGCANWSACSAARPWKSRFSRKRSTSRG